MRNHFRIVSVMIVTCVILSCVACSNDDDIATIPTTGTINSGNDPNFKIVENTDTGFGAFNRKVIVFDIPIYAVAAVEDVKLLHAANVMAQYLDNDEDGSIDNITIYNSMKSNKAFLFMWKTEADRDNFSPPAGFEVGQDLGADETVPTWHTNGHTGSFDAALEEVWHIVTNGGHERAYPEVFSSQAGSEISKAMDLARGGSFQSPPVNYPVNAWYTYDDTTCDYNCQVGEYLYWIMSSMLGGQENRLGEIGNEWKLNTRAKVEATDTKAWTIFTNPVYKMPSRLPDGTYKR
ncbi:hypothetical protein ATE84_0124 [Aquimarina sp. MAR_2010_214]|uniref:hypothetical protein n=1 Tax=Aquimarina sp. MAR_2010_214 TaxID=1250026 RepID=UPI000CC220C6|nr:hypothetical protein [Aquimarina sp. MAR_2010_214]PKV48134.1 hypothetical protein ATE84_0124 [Aquimarina sp. MAR_2010_214]